MTHWLTDLFCKWSRTFLGSAESRARRPPWYNYNKRYCGWPGREKNAIIWAILIIVFLLFVFILAYALIDPKEYETSDAPIEHGLSGAEIITTAATLVISVVGIVYFQVFYAGSFPMMDRRRFTKFQLKSPITENFLLFTLAYTGIVLVMFPSARLLGAGAVGRASPLAPITFLVVLLSWYIFQFIKVSTNTDRWQGNTRPSGASTMPTPTAPPLEPEERPVTNLYGRYRR